MGIKQKARRIALASQFLIWSSVPVAVYAAPIQFEDTSEKLGFFRGTESWGVAWGNLNGDEYPDIYNNGHRDYTRLYRNTGTGDFEDVSMEYDFHQNHFWMSNTQRDMHGAAWGDYDKDGDDDLLVGDEYDLFINGADSGGYLTHTTPSSLPQAHTAWKPTNNGQDITYVTRSECRANMSLFIDVDNDGDLDFVCGDEDAFPETGSSSEALARIPEVGNVLDVAFGDFNNDLKQDIILLRGGLRPNGAAKVNDKRIEAWFRNDTGSGFTFTATGEVTFLVDGDGGGAYLEEDVVVLNTNGTTSGSARGIYFSYSGGTWTVTDNHNSGHYVRIIAENSVSDPVMFGLVNRDLPQSTTHMVNTDAGFEQIYNTGLYTPMECRSVVAADFDNDMDLDLYMACGAGVSNLQNRYFDNDGDGTFTEIPGFGGEGPVGVGNDYGVAESVIAADYDVDGFMDLTVVNGLLYYPFGFGGPDNLYRNQGNSNHWIEIDLNGVTSNAPGLGAKVYVTAGGVTQMREQNGGYHRWGQNHQRLHFGLAGNTTVDQIRIEWPAGQVEVYNNVSADQLYNAVENSGLTPAVLGPEVKTVVASGEECGVPEYESTYGPMIQIWRDCGTDTWHLRSRSGLARLIENVPQVTAGVITADRNIGFATPINFTSVDYFSASSRTVAFETKTNDTYGNSKTINFSTAGLTSACINFSVQDIDAVIVGSMGKHMTPPFDLLNGFASCNQDSDGDGIEDVIDSDDDNDGYLDVDDAFPFDPTEWADSDGDGVGDNSDAFPNDATEATDGDGDGVGDNSDVDIDNDGIVDSSEVISGSNEDQVLDDFETNLGWTINPYNSDTATTGQWQVGNPSGTSTSGRAMQLGATTSGSNALVTATASGSSVGSNDIDSGDTSALSQTLALPNGTTTLKFNYYLAHLNNATSNDYFRVSIVSGGNTQRILNVLGTSTTRVASWTAFSADISAYAGQSIQLLVEAADASTGSLVEAAMDDILITVVNQGSSDQDGDGIPNEQDLDSDGDTIADVVEAGLTDIDGNYIVDDLVNDQGSVVNAPDSDGDGLPDFLDAESSNPANNGTSYDISGTAFAALDTNGDGAITSADSNGGIDADGDGIDDLVDSDPINPGGGSGVSDSDGDGVIDSEDAYPNDASRTVPSVSIASASVVESAGNVLLEVTLSAAPVKYNSVRLTTSNGSAFSGSDYTNAIIILSFAVGETHKTVSIPIIDNSFKESEETFSVNLLSLVNLDAGEINATVTIQDDDTVIIPTECFTPAFDRYSETGVFLWDTCDGSGEWRMRVTGGGNADGVFYEGSIESTGAIDFSEYSIEGHDTIDSSNPELLTYVLKTWNGAEDGLNFIPGADTCVTTTAPDLPIYLGEGRVLKDEGSLDLTTLEACDTGQIADECGMPDIDRSIEGGLFLWKDCVQGDWGVSLSGGGNSSGVFASGTVTSFGGFTELSQDSFESSDTFDNTTNPDEIVYSMRVWNSAYDSFGFIPLGTDTCLTLEEDIPMFLGEGKQLVASPLNLDTLASCNVAPDPAECGEPTYDNATEPGLYLWKNCKASGSAAEWHLQAVGGGLPWAPYTGVLSSTLEISVTGSKLEASDIIDAVLGDTNIDFMLYLANKGIDGLDFNIPAGSETCFSASSIPSGAQVYLGRDKQMMVDEFNLEDIGACP